MHEKKIMIVQPCTQPMEQNNSKSKNRPKYIQYFKSVWERQYFKIYGVVTVNHRLVKDKVGFKES